MRQDFSYAVRSLARNPSFSTVAIITLALGIGLNTSVFGIVNVLLFRPPPVERAHELVWISSASTKPDGPRGNMTYPDVDDMRSLPVVTGVMAYGHVQANVARSGQAERLDGQIVTGDYFEVLGIRPHRGQLIDDRPGNPVAVISFGLWQRMFGGRDDAVGADIHINGAPFTISGIAPRGFRGADVFAFQQALLDRARAVPGVRSATLASLVPLGGQVWVSGLTFPDRPSDPNARSERVSVNHVWPGFFGTLGIPIVAGRALDARDMGPQQATAVISETMARRHWPDRSPLGQRFSVDGARGPFVEVVGVARDTITDELAERPWPAAYLPRRRGGDDIALIAHAEIPSGDALRALEAQVRALDATVAVFQPMTLPQHIADRLDGERALSRMLTVVGLLALALAAIGLYGVVAYTVVRRTREIGVRVALGAQPSDVVRLFVGDAARLALMGVSVGLLPAIAVTAFLAGSLVGVRVADPIAMAGVMVVLTTVTLAAAYLPARHASRVDPLAARRAE